MDLRCQDAWETIKQKYMEAPILIAWNWEEEFHVHMDASNLVVGTTLTQNLGNKCNQPIAYASRLWNSAKHNYTTMERNVLAMVYTLHKFCHYLLNNRFVFNVDHITLAYLINKPQLFGRIMRWLLLFWEYDFTIIYKLRHIHSVADFCLVFFIT